ncbi:MAG TPA: phosphoribosyltransferase [Stellaceae bacterium]|nr:phosphoribosyltransferase [Stellaceae bacterium]
MIFQDRQDAGRRLAAKLLHLRDQQPVVLALPRGGVPIGCEIALALKAPLDLVLVRKIGAPGAPELAVGAIVDGGRLEKVIDRDILAELGVPQSYLDREIASQAEEIERRRKLYFKDRSPAPLANRGAIVVDDGIATGATMLAALLAIRRRQPSKLVLAVPVAPARAIERLRAETDEIVCLSTPEDFFAISQFYKDFHQIGDDEVLSFLHRAEEGAEDGRARDSEGEGRRDRG